MIKGAIFDMDGTLLDSMSAWDGVGEKYLRRLGCEPKADFNDAIKDLSLRQAASYSKNEYDIALSVDEIVDGVNAMVEDFYRNEVQLKPGIAEFLRVLNERGVKMCIATASDRSLVEAAIQHCGIDKYFSEIFTCGSVGHGKDEPHIYRQALESLGTEKHDTVVFEDSLYALRTAHLDGFATAAVFDEHEKNQEELKKLSDFYIEDFTDINALLKFL